MATNGQGNTELHIAAANRNVERLREIVLASMGDNEIVDARNSDGNTPLLYFIKSLKDVRADAETIDSISQVFNILTAAGAKLDKDIRNKEGQTLDMCIENLSDTVIRDLLKKKMSDMRLIAENIARETMGEGAAAGGAAGMEGGRRRKTRSRGKAKAKAKAKGKGTRKGKGTKRRY
jgi:hypothetical protein